MKKNIEIKENAQSMSPIKAHFNDFGGIIEINGTQFRSTTKLPMGPAMKPKLAQTVSATEVSNLKPNSQGYICLSDLYFANEKLSFSKSKITYYYSLVPKIQILFSHRRLKFIVGLVGINYQQRLAHENSVNVHLFKPVFRMEHGELVCYVATKEIMMQTMLSLFQVHQYHQMPQISVAFEEEGTNIEKLIENWGIEGKVLLCRVQSLLTFLLIEWLKIQRIDLEKVKNNILKIESSRLNPKYTPFNQLLLAALADVGLEVAQFQRYYGIKKFTSQSPFVYGFTFTYQSQTISAVMLPWGVELAQKLMETLFKLNPNIERVGIVGGVGYIGQSECSVDDIFLPSSILLGDQNNYFIKQFQNGINLDTSSRHFTDFNVVHGCMKSVFPQIGKLSNIATYRSILHKIDALDMQFQKLLQSVQRRSECKIGAVYYIMDLPKRDLHLGDTYYNKAFLQDLFATFKRGKYFCFEKTLDFLTA